MRAVVFCAVFAAVSFRVGGAELAEISPIVLSEEEREEVRARRWEDLRRKRDEANARNRKEWKAIENREAWEAYRDVRLERLRDSLGSWPEAKKGVNVRITGTVEGDGFVIENVVFESRGGDWVPANLYRPDKPTKGMAGILIAHAHHQGKEQGELQDMGMTWARAGCVVLVIDQVGYGERRAHPFDGPEDYPKEGYRWSRQDYYYRYDSGVQLHLAGESLMGWMVQDLMRGVDVLLGRKGIDPEKIILLGAVAGGGDPCGITAALDDRIAAAVPFNFGGPQPETVFPLPDDAEESFNYLMGSYWESTRGLRQTASDGFFHWMITSSIAPRRLIHAHEFSWDGERDPVWKRYRRIYGKFYGEPDRLAVAHGKGLLKGRPPDASHCGQIGRYHRKMIHPVFRRWFGIDVGEEDEFSARREKGELVCLTPEIREELKPAGLVELISRVGALRVAEARKQRGGLSNKERRERIRGGWDRLLGGLETEAKVASEEREGAKIGDGISVRRFVLEIERDAVIPVLLLSKEGKTKEGAPLVVGLAQAGKAGFLEFRSEEIAELVNGGTAVCLPDLRGTGETKEGSSRGRSSGDTNVSVNVLLHGETVLGQRVRDLHSVLQWLRGLEEIDPKHISLWGDSFVPANRDDTEFEVPHRVDGRPHQPEPMGGLVAMLGALFDGGIEKVYVRGGLGSFQSVLECPHVYVPHDVAVPGVLTGGDLCDLAAALAPMPLRLDGMVDGLNRRMTLEEMRVEYAVARESYHRAGAELVIGGESPPAGWLLGVRDAEVPDGLKQIPTAK